MRALSRGTWRGSSATDSCFYASGELDSVHDANERYWEQMDRSL